VALAGHGSVLAFGHGHMLRALAVTFIEAGIETASRLALDTASLSLLQVDQPSGRQLAIWNWTPAFASD
jgi:broad specificity phosphatase PhoE